MNIIILLLATLLPSYLIYILFFQHRRTSDSPPLPPGPPGWPIIGNLPQLGTKPHQTLHALSKVYGPLFKLNFGYVDIVVAASADVASQFLRTFDSKFSDRPTNSGAEHIAYNYQDLVFAPYGPRWRLLRKLCTVHLFSSKALNDLRHVREAEVALLVGKLKEAHGGDPVNLGQAVNVCVTNALARATVGRRVFAEGGGEDAAEFKEMTVELMRLAGQMNVGDFVPWLKWLDPQGVVRKMKRLHRKYDEFLDRIMVEHRRVMVAEEEGKDGGKDLLTVLMGLKEKSGDGDGGGQGMLTGTNIKALLLNLFTAGTDTTSSTVEWALAELIRHPKILMQAQHELDSVVGQNRLVSESDLPNLPLIKAIIKETFRLHPSTPLSLPRMASESCHVAGYHIPKGATLLVNVWAIARDPVAWPKPLEFSPARFLPGGPGENVDVKGNDFEVIPFGAGRRICAGMSLGLRMVQFLTATLVHAFDWTLLDGEMPEKLDMEEAYRFTLQRAVPLMVHPVPRLLHATYYS